MKWGSEITKSDGNKVRKSMGSFRMSWTRGQAEYKKNPGGREAEGREYDGLTCNVKTVNWFEKSEHIRWLRGPTEMYIKRNEWNGTDYGCCVVDGGES